MNYIDGYLIPVPEKNKQAYTDIATKASDIFLEFGAIRVVETWGDDIPPGKINDFRTAVIAEKDEHVVFSWIEWPSKQVRDDAMARVMTDERMKAFGDMPFSGARMIFGGFNILVDTDQT